MSATKFIEPGTILGPFVVERRLSGEGLLYFAHDDRAGVDSIVEVLREEVSAVARGRIIRDARTLSAMDHPGLVRIYAAGEHGEAPWVAMEVVRGVDLERLLKDRGAVPAARAVRWIAEATLALTAAHDMGIVHRALEPQNLMLTHDDEIKVKGFGMGSTRAVAYASPELLEHGLADERSDVWALGCVLFELTTGAAPFGTAGASILAAIERQEPVFPAHLPAALVEVIGACLKKSSFARVASMRELRSLLRDVHEHPGPAAGDSYPSSQWRASARPFGTEPPAMDGAARGTPSSSPRMRSSAPGLRHSVSSTSLRIAGAKGNVKGSVLRPAIAWFAETYGKDAIERVYQLSTPDLRATLRKDDPVFGIIPSGWYDAGRAGDLLVLLEDVANPSDSDAYNDVLAAAIAKDNVNGVYRALFRLVTSPELLEANIQRVWRTYCDEGTLVARVPRAGRLEFELRGWHHHHAQACRVLGFALQHVLRGVGYRGLVLDRVRCVGSGDTECAFEGAYLP